MSSERFEAKIEEWYKQIEAFIDVSPERFYAKIEQIKSRIKEAEVIAKNLKDYENKSDAEITITNLMDETDNVQKDPLWQLAKDFHVTDREVGYENWYKFCKQKDRIYDGLIDRTLTEEEYFGFLEGKIAIAWDKENNPIYLQA